MKLKILTLLICFTFHFLPSSSAAVAIKEKGNEVILSSQTKKESNLKSHRKWKWFQKKRKLKRRKFRLSNFFKWKKKKRIKQEKTKEVDNRKVDPIAVLSFTFTLVSTLLFLFTPFGFSPILILSFVLLGGLLGIIGLNRIRQNPEEKKGELLALIGIMGLVVLVLLLLIFRFLNFLDF